MIHHLTIEGAPVSYKRKRLGRNRALPPDVRAWMESAVWQLRTQWRKPPLTGKTEAWFVVYLGKGQRMDPIAAVEGAMDALQRADVVTNDKHVIPFHVDEGRDWDRPRIEVALGVV